MMAGCYGDRSCMVCLDSRDLNFRLAEKKFRERFGCEAVIHFCLVMGIIPIEMFPPISSSGGTNLRRDFLFIGVTGVFAMGEGRRRRSRRRKGVRRCRPRRGEPGGVCGEIGGVIPKGGCARRGNRIIIFNSDGDTSIITTCR